MRSIQKKEPIMKSAALTALTTALVAITSLGTMAAHAEGLYVGGSLGSTSYPNSVNGVGVNGSMVSGKVFGGYQLTPNFALEAGIAGLGRRSDINGTVDSRGFFLDAVGIAPLNDKWSLLGRVGVERVDFKTSAGNDNGNGIKVGLGAQYALTSRTSLRAEWERYRPSVFGEKPNVDQYTVGVRVGF